MPSNVQALAQMADHAATQITASHTDWTDFLKTAARLYKYPYHEQLMIHVQRPDATAVLNRKGGDEGLLVNCDLGMAANIHLVLASVVKEDFPAAIQ